ncbi:MAG: superoxide dismutase, partial [Agromyces sp.]
NMSPEGGDKPVGDLADAIADQFGSFDAFRAHFTAVAMGVQGSGWAVLAWDSLGQRLIIVQFFDQQANMPAGIIPLLMLDVWEHAYYLDYKNVRADYVNAFWNIVNWKNVSARFATSRDRSAGLLLLSE